MNFQHQNHIFIVDNNKVFTLALKAIIETKFTRHQPIIHLFNSDEHCLQNINLIYPDIIILDYYLNGKAESSDNGLKVLDNIKLLNNISNVIMLTSSDEIEVALESFHHGASDYVIKNDKQFENIIYSIEEIFTKNDIVFSNQRNVQH